MLSCRGVLLCVAACGVHMSLWALVWVFVCLFICLSWHGNGKQQKRWKATETMESNPQQQQTKQTTQKKTMNAEPDGWNKTLLDSPPLNRVSKVSWPQGTFEPVSIPDEGGPWETGNRIQAPGSCFGSLPGELQEPSVKVVVHSAGMLEHRAVIVSPAIHLSCKQNREKCEANAKLLCKIRCLQPVVA